MYGPKDGAEVPDTLWVLTQIEFVERLPGNKRLIYCYELNDEDHNYYYAGQFDDGGEDE
jgi:hypothetical protein